jgi:hypothetical protein
VAGKRPGSCTGNDGAVLVLVVVVLGVEQALDHLNWKMYDDPVLGGAVAKVIGVDTSLAEPLVDQVVCLRARLDELIDLVGAEVVTIASMVRVGDLEVSAHVKSRDLANIPSWRWRSSSSNFPCFKPICSWIVFPP